MVVTMLALLWTEVFAIRTVLSGSMEPTIPTGAVVITRAQEAYSPGEIITFRSSERASVPTTHRIVELAKTGGEVAYVTRGDANDTNDFTSTPHSRVLGRVVLYIPFIGYVLDFVKRPIGFLLVLGIPASILVITETYSLIRRNRESRKNSDISESNPPKDS